VKSQSSQLCAVKTPTDTKVHHFILISTHSDCMCCGETAQEDANISPRVLQEDAYVEFSQHDFMAATAAAAAPLSADQQTPVDYFTASSYL